MHARAFKLSPFSAIDYESLAHWSAELSRTEGLHLSDKRVSEIAIHSDNPFITLRYSQVKTVTDFELDNVLKFLLYLSR